MQVGLCEIVCRIYLAGFEMPVLNFVRFGRSIAWNGAGKFFQAVSHEGFRKNFNSY